MRRESGRVVAVDVQGVGARRHHRERVVARSVRVDIEPARVERSVGNRVPVFVTQSS